VKKVDTNALKFNQINIIGWTILAFVLDWPWLVGLVGVAMAIGAVWPDSGPFRLLYKNVVVPANLVKPNVIADDPAPHRFALGFGAVVVLLATVILALGLPIIGWALSAIVALLAFINFAFNYCVGCQIYFLLGRLGIISSGRTA
jgi:uncharacterized protein DUF4395